MGLNSSLSTPLVHGLEIFHSLRAKTGWRPFHAPAGLRFSWMSGSVRPGSDEPGPWKERNESPRRREMKPGTRDGIKPIIRTYNGASAIITGGASGIGRALGEELARRGSEVVLADLQIEMAEEVASKIRASGGKAKAMKLDATDFPCAQRFPARVDPRRRTSMPGPGGRGAPACSLWPIRPWSPATSATPRCTSTVRTSPGGGPASIFSETIRISAYRKPTGNSTSFP